MNQRFSGVLYYVRGIERSMGGHEMRKSVEFLRDAERGVQASFVILDLYVESRGCAESGVETTVLMQHTLLDFEDFNVLVDLLREYGYAAYEAGMRLSLTADGVREVERQVQSWIGGVDPGPLTGLLTPAREILLEREWERARILDTLYDASDGRPLAQVDLSRCEPWVIDSQELPVLGYRGYVDFPESWGAGLTLDGVGRIEEIRAWYAPADPRTWSLKDFSARYESWIRRPEAPDECSMVRQGRIWTLVYDGVEVSVPHSIGITYITLALRSDPEIGISVHDLCAAGRAPGLEVSRPDEDAESDLEEILSISSDPTGARGDSVKTLDSKARTAIRQRLEQIAEERKAAEAQGDFDRAEMLDLEQSELLAEYSRATGLRGRDRLTGDDQNRARDSVLKAMRRSIAQIALLHPQLGAHLQNSLTLKKIVKYRPERPLSWNF